MNDAASFVSRGVIRLVASAGAGKTHALAFRYLTLLLGSEDPAEELGRILAVTFTRKAAGEMRERVLSWLEALSRPRDQKDLALRRKLAHATGLSEEELGERAERALEAVFHRWPFFSVGTIDAFLASAARASAFELGLPPGFSLVLNAHPRLRRAFLALLSEAGRDGDLRRDLETLFQEKKGVQGALSWDLIEDFLREQRALHDRLAGVAASPVPLEDADTEVGQRVEEVGKRAADLLKLLEAKGIQTRNTETFHNQLKKMAQDPSLSAFFELKSTYFQKETLAQSVKKEFQNRLGSQEEEAWSRFRESLKALALRHALALGNPALRLKGRLEEALEEQARRENAVLLEWVARALARHLAGGGLPSVLLALMERYRHLLVDEFQDTSEVQWQALRPLATEALARGGSFFFVGDPKQAIYRFRGGAPHLFGEAFEDLAGTFGGRSDALPQNHRSREVLVEFFNRTFSERALKTWSVQSFEVSEEEYDRFLAPVFRDASQQLDGRHPGGYVRVAEEAPDPEAEGGDPLERAAREAASGLLPDLLRRGYRPGEVAFLVRTNDQARTITKALEEAGFRVATESAARVTTHPRVQELLALLRFLDTPTDDLSFATFASGTLMERAAAIPAADLHALLARWAFSRKGALYRAYREAFPRAWKDFVEPLFRGVGYLAPYDLLQDFLERSGAFSRFPEDEAFLAHFLEVVSRMEREGAATAGSLLAALVEDPEEEGLEVPLPEGGDAFRVLTVHKAKGLGFPVVVLLLPSLKKPSGGDFLLPVREGLLWVRTKKFHQDISPALAQAKRENHLLAFRDELCAFYVALTRAQDELHVVLGRGEKMRPPLQAPLEEGTPTRREASAEAANFLSRPPARSPWRSRILPPADPGYRPPPPEAWEAVREGKRVHRLLEAGFRIGEEGRESPTGGGTRPGEATGIADRFASLWAHPDLGPLLNPPSGEVLNEVEILDEEGRIHRVDRMIVEDDRVTVVDWKTGQEASEKHRDQVALYCRLVSALYPGRRVSGRLAYLALERVEEVPW